MASRAGGKTSHESANEIAANYFFQEVAMKHLKASSATSGQAASIRVLQKRMLQSLVSKGLDVDGGCLGLRFNDRWGQCPRKVGGAAENPAIV